MTISPFSSISPFLETTKWVLYLLNATYAVSYCESTLCSWCIVFRVLSVLQFVFSQNQPVFIMKAYDKNWLYKFIHEQFIAGFLDRESPTKLSINRLIQKFMTRSSVILSRPFRARSQFYFSWLFTVSTFLMWYIDINIFDIAISIFHPILLISFDIFSITKIMFL